MAAPWLSIRGSVIGMGVALAALVVIGASMQHRRHVEATRSRPG
jgi:hypothetical protein